MQGESLKHAIRQPLFQLPLKERAKKPLHKEAAPSTYVMRVFIFSYKAS